MFVFYFFSRIRYGQQVSKVSNEAWNAYCIRVYGMLTFMLTSVEKYVISPLFYVQNTIFRVSTSYREHTP